MLNSVTSERAYGARLGPNGVTFRLWAPNRDAVEVLVDGVRHAMRAQGAGWYAVTVAGAHAGSRYGFAFPGDELVVPDPAARFQPDGAHGLSEVIDLAAHERVPFHGRPWHETVLYELHVGTFTPEGTYRAAIAHLDAMAQLGITAIELMPLAQPAGARNWGYDGVLPFAPQAAYGRPEDLQAFIDAAHRRNLTVFLDVVYNHFGPEGNYLGAYAREFFTDRHHTPWGSALNVDGEHNENVRAYFIENALYWLEDYGFDGLRFDAVHEIRDDSTRPFLRELAEDVRRALGTQRHVHLVVENDTNDAALLDVYDAQWNDDAHHAYHVLLTGEGDGYYRDYAQRPARALARALGEGFAYQGEPSTHRGGIPRGTRSAALEPTRFVNFIQNHDQIGNRAFGDRLSALAPAAALRAAAATLLLAPQIPLLFMGEEWAASSPFLFFADFGPELARAVTEGRRKEFAAWTAFADPAVRERIPDPQAEATRDASRLNWNERAQDGHREMLAHYRELLRLRARAIVPLLAAGLTNASWQTRGTNTIDVRWQSGTGAELGVLANLGAAPARLTYAFAGEPLYTLGDVPVRADATMIAPWSVGWFLRA